VLSLLAPTLQTVDPKADAAGGPPWWLFIVVVAVIVVVGAVMLLVAVRKSNEIAEVPCGNCGKILMPEWPQCMFCKTPRGFKIAQLEVLSGPLMGRTITLEGEVTSIGSAPGSTVVITDQGVSRKHVGIRRQGAAYELADLGSTNGVYVNGEKVAKKRLELGDVIRVGVTEMVFKA
jgi:hypothetical protein